MSGTMRSFAETVGTRTVLEKTTLFEAVMNRIRDQIAAGIWKPGDKLPTVPELVEEFGVSRTPIREAIKSLNTAGVLEIRAGKGIYVSPNLSPSVAEGMASLTLWDGTSVVDILDIREILEVEAARRAAQNAEPKHILQLQRLLREMESTKDDPDTFSRADLAFHLTIAEASGNGLFKYILEALGDLLREQFRKDPLAEEALRSHARLLATIENQDGVGAGEAMREHLQEVRRYHVGR